MQKTNTSTQLTPDANGILGQRRRLVVCGEVRSGKSSAINALVRAPMLPTESESVWRPPLLLRHSDDRPHVLIHNYDGGVIEAGVLAESADLSETSLCEVFVNAPHIRNVDVIELPFHYDGEISEETLSMMESADLLIWVSIASQAWRLSEKAIVSRLSPRMRERTIFCISRSDKLRNINERDRILERVQREAGDYFSEIVFLQASEKNILASLKDDEVWNRTGGKALAEIIAERFVGLENAANLEAPMVMLDDTGAENAIDTNVIAFSSIYRTHGRNPADETEVAVQPAPKPTPAPAPTPKFDVPPVAAALMDEICAITGNLNGAVAAGIGRFADGACLAGFVDQPESGFTAAKCSMAALACLKSQDNLKKFASSETGYGEVSITAGPYLLLVSPSAEGKDYAFLMVRHEKTNNIIGRNALKRIEAIWAGARH